MTNYCNKNLESNHQTNKQKLTLHHQSIKKFEKVVNVLYLQAMQLKIRSSHLTCKFAKQCLNLLERVEVVEKNKEWYPPFLLSCESLVSVREYPDIS